MSTYLSSNFTLEEFTASQTAERDGIDNTPPPDVVANLKVLAYGLETVRLFLGKPIFISSGYRGEPLEKAITVSAFAAWCKKRGKAISPESWAEYFASKSHPKGEAADFTCPAYGPPAKVMSAIVQHGGIEYDQIILEYATKPNGGWVHISFSERNRRQALVIDHNGQRAYA